MISETWSNASTPHSCNLQNYWLEQSLQSEIRGKGAGIYIHKSLPYKRRHDLDSNINEFQSVFIELEDVHSQPLIAGSIYRSPSYPSAPFVEYIENVLNTINHERTVSLIGGDYNIDILLHQTSESCSAFLNSLAALGFLPCISLPTRLTSHSSTLIDNFFCNEISLVAVPTVIMADISDHLPIAVNLQKKIIIRNKVHETRNVFDFRKTESLRLKLSERLNDFDSFQDAEEACNFLTHEVTSEIANHSIKKGNRRSVPIQPWISFDLLRRTKK